jgi:hypothetical protein
MIATYAQDGQSQGGWGEEGPPAHAHKEQEPEDHKNGWEMMSEFVHDLIYTKEMRQIVKAMDRVR